jgi:hypothetical protein
LHPAIRQALADPNHPLVAACKKDGPDFVYPPPLSSHAHNQPRQSSTAAAVTGSGKGIEDDSNSSECQDAADCVAVQLPPPRADINFTPVFALSLSLLQQAAAAAAAAGTLPSSKQACSLIDCIPGFEIVSRLELLQSHFCSINVFSRCGQGVLWRRDEASIASVVQTVTAAKTAFVWTRRMTRSWL